jgi:multimeric flavodoxin WrbA/nitrite reductase/ring-hydroxylating ferredoxin subunit
LAQSPHRRRLPNERWHDVGDAAELARIPLQQITVHGTRMALSCVGGVFGAIHGSCNHAGGPLGQGSLEGDFVVCPWHQWRFHRLEGHGERGFEEDVVPAYRVRVQRGRVQVSVTPHTKRRRKPHSPHPLAREPRREPGPVRVVGISTTAMNADHPRFSTSDALLDAALAHAGALGCGTRRIRLRELSFRHCEGYYSKAARACTWPCSITQMDPQDQLDQVYEALVHWADVYVIATPIRWGGPSSLYFKMIERMNCIQNQLTLANRTLLRNKVLTAIITGGQDNVQAVAGQMLGFFTELGCHIPQYAYIAHSRGWSAEDMERNVAVVQHSEELREAARALVDRGVELAARLLATETGPPARGGRKGQLLRSAEAALAEPPPAAQTSAARARTPARRAREGAARGAGAHTPGAGWQSAAVPMHSGSSFESLPDGFWSWIRWVPIGGLAARSIETSPSLQNPPLDPEPQAIVAVTGCPSMNTRAVVLTSKALTLNGAGFDEPPELKRGSGGSPVVPVPVLAVPISGCGSAALERRCAVSVIKSVPACASLRICAGVSCTSPFL